MFPARSLPHRNLSRRFVFSAERSHAPGLEIISGKVMLHLARALRVHATTSPDPA
jgi:hypothetical protein